jgi:hypothetical protein
MKSIVTAAMLGIAPAVFRPKSGAVTPATADIQLTPGQL